jgi:site-specific DNA recombinase
MKKNDACIAIYSRKSKFTGKGESIGNQVELCREYIRIHYGEDVAEQALIFEDEGFSGGNLNRPDFRKMMDAAKKRKFRAIIVYRLDRISRNISDFASLIESLSRLDIDFVSIREQFDTSSPMGRAMMYIASVFSQLERETIAERIRDNMRELAKTGRWLGGTTPTGYASEAVKSVTIDGKTKKACKLKLIPEEAETVKTIYDLYVALDSQTLTETELLKRGIKTKNGKNFSRFAVKAILQNPVYMIADQDAYEYFTKKGTDLFASREKFDGLHGIMAYNRTDQEKGRATIPLPPDQWIVSVGQHPGLIPGKVWVGVQDSLERNKSKSYRKPRRNEALLTGLLYCSCGNRMYPKLSNRETADGQGIYSYVCSMKARSQRNVCGQRNANGNTLDLAIIAQIKGLADNNGDFLTQLEQSRKFYTSSQTEYETHLSALRQEKADAEKKIDGLVDSLADLGNSGAKDHIARRIEELNQVCQDLTERIKELETLTAQNSLGGIEFDVMKQLLSMFKNSIDEMSVEQKRAAIRSLVHKVVWDGENAHIVLFGSPEDEIDQTGLPSLITGLSQETDGQEDDCLGKEMPPDASKSRWGAGSILNTPGRIGRQAHVFIWPERGDALDEANGSDGDEIVLVGGRNVIFLQNVGDQAQVVLHQLVPGLQISLGRPGQILPFLLRAQGSGKRAVVPQAQGKTQRMDQQKCG